MKLKIKTWEEIAREEDFDSDAKRWISLESLKQLLESKRTMRQRMNLLYDALRCDK